MNALIIADIQNDFMPDGSLPVPFSNEIIPTINLLQDLFPLVIAIQDWHPANHKSFASNHPGKKVSEKIMLHNIEQVLWPDHCIQGSEGAAFVPALKMNKVEAIFRKGTDPEIDSYSGFFDNGHKKSTGLSGCLRERKIQKIFICGVAADYCVFYTAKDSLKENFETYIIEDATRAINVSNFIKAKNEILAQGGHIITSDLLYHYVG